MKFLFIHRLVSYTKQIAALTGALISVGSVCWYLSIFDGKLYISLLFAIAISAVLGTLLGYFLLGYPLMRLGIRINGAPFYIGDRVRILTGCNKYKTVIVYKIWEERNQVRVDLGKDAMAKATDVYSMLHVCRISDSRSKRVV